MTSAFITSASGHDFICGLERDAAANFYTASGNQGVLRLPSDGSKAEVLATGFRNPDGVALTPGGNVTVPCSEGEWTSSSMICEIKPPTNGAPPQFFGYGGPKNNKPPDLPLVYIPRGMDNSSGGQVVITSDRWGPLEGKMIHLSYGTGSHFLLLRDEATGQPQGAIVPLVGEFLSGAHRGRFNPKDGQLYVTGMGGWGTYGVADGCFHRVRYTGGPVHLPAGFHVHENGILLTMIAAVVVVGLNWFSALFHAYQAELYPTEARATGVGFTYAWSRMSMVLLNVVMPGLIAASPARAFGLMAAALLGVGVTIGLFGPMTNARPLEETGNEEEIAN